MSPEEIEELIADCPYLYHMAMRGSWPLIREYGLLPTKDLLALFQVDGDLATRLLTARRPESVAIAHPDVGNAMVRDQIPMHEADLVRCLKDGLTPQDWYKLLNERVFFWLAEARLDKLLCAGAYRAIEHDVLTVPTRLIIEQYRERIELSPMNSGCTKPMAHPRGAHTFLSIKEYPYQHWKFVKRRPRRERVVELTVIGGVQNIRELVTEISIRSCGKPKKVIGP